MMQRVQLLKGKQVLQPVTSTFMMALATSSVWQETQLEDAAVKN